MAVSATTASRTARRTVLERRYYESKNDIPWGQFDQTLHASGRSWRTRQRTCRSPKQ
jgi:hypothetical protein